MNTRFHPFRTALGLLLLLGSAASIQADITVRLSVKFILNTNGAYPVGGANTIGTNSGFQFEVDRGNGVLTDTGRGYRLQVVEYLPIQPPAPAGRPPNYWFTNYARGSRAEVEAASIADPVSWRRNQNGAINVYVNNSSSGQCSFPGNGDTITLGESILIGTVLHEIGHFFDLSHTHGADATCTNPPPYLLEDGDGLVETVPDHLCYTNRASLQAALPLELQPFVDTAWRNVMSYHQEDQLLGIQMDYWAVNANFARNAVCDGFTRFVATDGGDFPFRDGLSPGQAFATVSRALAKVTGPKDVVLFRTGNYTAPAALLTTRCTLRNASGPVTISR